MGSHRARRGDRRLASAVTPRSTHSGRAPGRRRAVAPTSPRSPLLKALPSAPVLVGVAALAVSAGGAVTSLGDGLGRVAHVSGSLNATSSVGASAMGGTDALSAEELDVIASREVVVSRDSRRDALAAKADAELVERAEAQAVQRNAELKQFRDLAEQQAAKIKANQWVLPLTSYRISATFGQSSYLWARTHTGIDLSAPSGTPIHAVAGGVVTETGYDGSYGNKTVITLEDGTEIWYCHQTSFLVDVGDVVRSGDVIGTVGSTGNSTGPHLHLEVRPGGGDPVDPYAAMLQHGLTP